MSDRLGKEHELTAYRAKYPTERKTSERAMPAQDGPWVSGSAFWRVMVNGMYADARSMVERHAL